MIVRTALALLLLAAGARADETLADRIAREYVTPALDQVQGAVEGRAPEWNWTPPALPGGEQARRFSEDVSARWIAPLMDSNLAYAQGAAGALAAARQDAGPADPGWTPPDPAPFLDGVTLSPAAAGLTEDFERRWLPRILPEDYIRQAAGALGSANDDAGPPEPDLSDLAAPPAAADAAPDSTRLAHGSGGGGAPRLKPMSSRFSHFP